MLVTPRSSRDLRVRASGRAAANTQRGMTLLEIMIVLAILGLVMGVLVVPTLLDKKEQSEVKTTYIEAQKLATETYLEWSLVHKSGCPTLEDLAKIKKKSKLEDPWGQPYVVHCGDNKPPNFRFGIASNGPDGTANTADDIKSWEEQ